MPVSISSDGAVLRPIEAVDWKTGRRIGRRSDGGAGRCGAAKAVFGTEQRDQIDTGFTETLDIAHALGIHSGLIGHETHPAAAHQLHAVGEQDLDARSDRRLDRRRRHRPRPGQAAGKPKTPRTQSQTCEADGFILFGRSSP